MTGIRAPSIAPDGTVVWASNNRCGLLFASTLSVKEWLAAPTGAEQQRVDDVVALVKAGKLTKRAARSQGCNLSRLVTTQQLVDDLNAISALLQDLEEDLASSEQTLTRHSRKLQNLDIAMQMVRTVTQELTLDGDANKLPPSRR